MSKKALITPTSSMGLSFILVSLCNTHLKDAILFDTALIIIPPFSILTVYVITYLHDLTFVYSAEERKTLKRLTKMRRRVEKELRHLNDSCPIDSTNLIKGATQRYEDLTNEILKIGSANALLSIVSGVTSAAAPV